MEEDEIEVPQEPAPPEPFRFVNDWWGTDEEPVF
jgi:hypothetical protein